MNRPQQPPPLTMAENEAAALAAEMFDHFSSATTMRQILGLYRNMCDTIGLRPGPLNEFYPKLKSKIKSWKAQALWKKFDARALHRVYNKGTACNGTRVLVIGAGPCGLRTAIEAQLLGAKVVLVEKRDRISRNNVLHLWPFLITDLRNLGAKKFYGKFCAGSIDHISIRQLQCILLKVALLLGVEVHEGVSFENTIEPKDGCGWRAQVSPEDHAVSHYEFDVLIGADGKRNTLEGFKRKEFRGKLAIAITANFINKKTEAEAKAEEISGVAFIFNQSFFKELYQTTGIDLENIVYYKDETHYFVMTAKKHSLIDKGVIVQDFSDPAELLSAVNVNTERLLDYAKEAAEFSTKYQMPNLEFAVNHYGKPDVAMFDFTSMFASEISCRVTVRKNYRLLQCLVGDSLLEPFWPTGSGCARGFLSSMDAGYAIKLWNNQRNSILAVLAQRESIYRLLAQTTPENLHRDIGSYTLDPATRYPNLNRSAVTVHQVKHLLNTDDPALLEQTFMDSNALQLVPDQPMRRKRRTGDTVPLSTVLLRWIRAQLNSHDFIQNLTDVSECFTNGQVLCALINRYRPDLVDLASLRDCSVKECNELAFKIIEVELRIPPVMTAADSLTLENVDPKLWLTYLEQICEVFRGEIPHVKHPKLDFAELKEKQQGNKVPDFSRLLKFTSRKVKSPSEDVDMAGNTRSAIDDDRGRRSRKLLPESSAGLLNESTSRRAKKRRSHEKFGNVEERMKRLQEIEANRNDRQNKRRLQRAQQTQNFYKSLHMLQANTLLRESDSSSPFEDYSIFLYRQSAPEFNDRVKELERKLLYPDRERGIASASLRNTGPDDQFNDRIKSMEKQIAAKTGAATDKKPKDLLRAIGKIESNDWNIREIEKKIEQSKKTEVGKSREKVPKWSKEQFLQRQNKMARPLDADAVDEKFKEIDQTIKNLDKQLKEGTVLERGERGNNKVASIAGSFKKKENTQPEDKGIQKSNSKSALVFNTPAVSEICHFCKQKVYLMEKITAEGLVLHRACLKCHHCHTSLRLGGYAFDRDNPQGLFYCTQHYRLPAKVMRPIPKKSLSRQKIRNETDSSSKIETTPERIRLEGIANLDLLNRGQTPERIEFENATAMSDGEPSLENIIDENEWTDRNFGSGTDESSEIYSSDSESDSDLDNYEEAMESPLGAQTLQLATDWIGKQRYSSNQYSDDDDSDDDEFYDSSEDDEADSQTEGEELEKAREIRMQEVKLKPLPYLATDTETEIQSDSESSSPIVELNSATEISTDSEFEQDPVKFPPPNIVIDDTHLRKPTKVQIKQTTIENGIKRPSPTTTSTKPSFAQHKRDLEQQNEFKPLVQVDPSVLSSSRMPLRNPRPGDYLLNKTASTEGIASKRSLELKKRYLLGESISGGIMKSDSTSVLDSKFKNFHSNISECQKLLNPSTDSVMQSFIKNTTPAKSPLVGSKEMDEKNSDEKENVYGKFVIDKNEINKTDIVSNSDALKISDLTETINTTLVDNKIREMSPKIEIIDLVTPEKVEPIIDLSRIELSEKMVKRNQKFINELDVNDDEIEVIDLTGDSPAKDRAPDDEATKDIDVPAPIIEVKSESLAEKSKSAIDSMLSQSNDSKKSRPVEDEARPRSPAQETSIRVPNIPWSAKKMNSDLESDSLSSSTSSSVDDIPHFILDSTTSPDTQPGDLPRLEVRDTSGELMQIDSLMIIDGKYVGDPEDLKHMKMPDGTRVTEQLTGEVKCDKVVLEKKIPRYESFSHRKPDLKFDTKNENKIDTLKNIPLVLPAVEANASTTEKIVKPSVLHLSDTMSLNKDLDDMDKTPTAATYAESTKSDSETEFTGQVLTETELSDWTADDAVSENFVDIEFVLNSNKGTIKRKKSKKKLSSHKTHITETETPKICPIVNKELDFEGIEFMDTGSEDSCLETYSATNKAMLKNRGYVQFVENNSIKGASSYKSDAGYGSSPKESFESKSFKTPNSLEIHEAVNKEVAGIDYIEQGACVLANDIDLKTPMNEVPPMFNVKKPFDMPADSLNDIDDDSLLMIASQGTTTEDSDALTVVTSPVDSTPKNVDTPNSDRRDMFNESSPPKENNSYDTTTSKESRTPTRKQSLEESGTPNRRKDSDECTYEEYVRKLQMKISQISNARDSIDIRKTRRKSSKGDNSGNEQTQQSNSVIDSNKSLSVFVNKPAVDATSPITVMERLEEITKERTKQKDLIHELVMDKLQSKKQLNAEKRLNRSRNRSSMFSPGNSPQAPPHIGTACSNGPHFHIGQTERPDKLVNSSDRWNITKTPYSISKLDSASTTRKDRPFSDVVETPIKELPKILKTQSFCVYSTPSIYSIKTDGPSQYLGNGNEFTTPVPPPRRKIDDTVTQTEKLRQDARARARLKSNQDLGLSPDEKIQLLRKRFNLDHLADEITRNKCDDMKIRERKMMTSKSVNDISETTSQEHVNDHNFGSSKTQYKQNDFTSDPNLAEEDGGQKRRHRNKDPERRKSIIRAVSDFFHKKRDSKETSPTNGKEKSEGMFGRFRLSPKSKAKDKDEPATQHERSKSEDYLKIDLNAKQYEEEAPPIPPLPINYQRSDDESCSANESRKLKAHTKASRQAELKRLRIAQEIQREQEEIEVKLKDLEARGVLLEKALRGEEQNLEVADYNGISVGANDEKLLKELLEIWRNITQLKKRDDELGIRQQELKLEHRHAQLKEQLNTRLSCSKLDKSSSDVAAEGAILNEMLEIVAKRAALRPSDTMPHSSSQMVDGLESDI
ncbi:F-actin-monooxygenase Mical isoform X2 [Bradysia coprophila]|uniref:F-actin-monooxygenase Mical isoform X2 n=1 Tax=Bradysia coprophila TaxID=38358 RepID=UPI00187D8158|nr:F-actin-monooxygenase Mical isoform X2 [Bradysia coprophila]